MANAVMKKKKYDNILMNLQRCLKHSRCYPHI